MAAATIALGPQLAEARGEESLVVGLLLPPDEPLGASIKQGILAAVAGANEGGGRQVKLAVRGRLGNWGSDASEAALLVMDDGAEVLVAPSGGAASHLMLQVAGRTAIPVATLCPDTSVTKASIPWALRVAPSTLDEARPLFAGTAASRWLAFVPKGRAGREVSADLSAAAAAGKRAITKLVEVGGPLPQSAALRELLASVRPEGILVWLEPVGAGRLVRSLRGAGFTGTLAGPMCLASTTFLEEAREEAEGFLVPVVGGEASREWASFASRYRKLFGADPDTVAAIAHDAALLLIALVKKAAPREPHTAFPPVGPVAGATGLLTFDEHGNRLVSLQLRRYRDGHLARG